MGVHARCLDKCQHHLEVVATIFHPRELSGFTPRNEGEPSTQVVVLDVLPGEAGDRVRNGSCLQRNYITMNVY